MLSKKVKSVPIDSITFDRSTRQRSEIDVSDIIESIKRRGVLTPICITESGRLIFGERRLTAAKQCGYKDILARIAPDNLSEHDLQILELEENLMRAELPWQDRARAMHKLWELSGRLPKATFAESIGYAPSVVNRYLDAATEIAAGNERVAKAPTLNKAVNVTIRQRDRESNNVLADIIDTIGGGEAPPVLEEAPSIINESFHAWAPLYIGPKFNLIHCDFPYGIGLDESDQLQVGGTAHQTYRDTEDTFWQLCQTLATHKDRFISHSAHMIFWYSMKFHREILDFFAQRMPEWTFDEYPLVWLKSDNRGIAPDVTRRPRRIYETALFGWRGDRKIVRMVSNAYAAPKGDGAHPSVKPEPMLRHFLGMVCDGNSRLLDPTCGSGTAIRAAESLDCERALGLEIDPDFYELSLAKLRQSRASARLAESFT